MFRISEHMNRTSITTLKCTSKNIAFTSYLHSYAFGPCKRIIKCYTIFYIEHVHVSQYHILISQSPSMWHHNFHNCIGDQNAVTLSLYVTVWFGDSNVKSLWLLICDETLGDLILALLFHHIRTVKWSSFDVSMATTSLWRVSRWLVVTLLFVTLWLSSNQNLMNQLQPLICVESPDDLLWRFYSSHYHSQMIVIC